MILLFFSIFCSISPSLGIYFYVFLLGFEDGITVLEGVTLSRHVGISLAFGVFFNLLINRLSIKSLFKNYLSFLIMLFIFFVWIHLVRTASWQKIMPLHFYPDVCQGARINRVHRKHFFDSYFYVPLEIFEFV